MALIIPFKGITYNPERVGDFSLVTAPPYDVISPTQQEEYHNLHPNNIIRLILGEKTPEDSETNTPHTRAAKYFTDWISEGVLREDDKPTLYLTAMDFPHEGRSLIRYGLIALVGLEPFSKKIILPHERTFSKVKTERLELTKKCKANFSPVFSLYPDEGESLFERLKAGVEHVNPDMDFLEKGRYRHRLWRLTDPEIHRMVGEAMADKRIFIADGHHRYETGLNYRSYLAERQGGELPENHPAQYIMMYLCSMADPGLIILPAHRLLMDIEPEILETFPEKAREFFDVETFPFDETNKDSVKRDFISRLRRDSITTANTIGTVIKNRKEFLILTLKPNVMDRFSEKEVPETFKGIDVVVLTQLLFMEILKFDHERLDNENLIRYSSIFDEAVEEALEGKCDMAFMLNPTRMDQVQEVSLKGFIMPRKSTYFYPKVLSGQVMYRIKP